MENLEVFWKSVEKYCKLIVPEISVWTKFEHFSIRIDLYIIYLLPWR